MYKKSSAVYLSCQIMFNLFQFDELGCQTGPEVGQIGSNLEKLIWDFLYLISVHFGSICAKT